MIAEFETSIYGDISVSYISGCCDASDEYGFENGLPINSLISAPWHWICVRVISCSLQVTPMADSDEGPNSNSTNSKGYGWFSVKTSRDTPPIDYGLMNEVDLDYGNIDHVHYEDHDVPDEHAGRGDSRTYMRSQDATRGVLRSDGSRKSYNGLEAINRGVGSDTNTQLNEKEARLRDVDLVCERMECTDLVHKQSRYIIERIEIQDFDRKVGAEELVLSVVSLYANIGEMHERRHIRREDEWKSLVDDWGADDKMIKRIRVKLQEEGHIDTKRQ